MNRVKEFVERRPLVLAIAAAIVLGVGAWLVFGFFGLQTLFIDEEVAEELIRRAQDHIEKMNAQLDEERRTLGVSDEIADLGAFKPALLVELGKGGVKSLDDLADLASDELREMLPDAGFSEEESNEIIMAARAHWFDDEPEPADADAESGAEKAESAADVTQAAVQDEGATNQGEGA